MIEFIPVDSQNPKNFLEIHYKEAHTDVNEHDSWNVTSPMSYNDVSKEDVKILMRCFAICEKEIEEARKGYGIPYNQLYLEEKEEYLEEFDDIQVDDSNDVITFKKNNKDYDIWYSFDMGMPTEDDRYFAGIKFLKAFYYDEQGNKFEIKMS